jgi:DNA-binding GntR family transcriptional regulator
MLQVVEHPSLPERVHRELREQILNGVFRPGKMLRQEELARRLGVSRAPLREALPRLEAEGLVVLYPRRGYAVISLDPAEITEIFELRMALEKGAALIAASRRTPADVAEVRAIRREMKSLDLQRPALLIKWFELNVEFHRALLRPSGLKHYARLIANLRTVLEPYIRMETTLTGDLKQAEAEHDKLLAAFADGDPESFARATGEHIQHTAERLLVGLKGRPQPGEAGGQ